MKKEIRLLKIFIFISTSVMRAKILAAPIPVTSSSFVISSHTGKFVSEHGFSIHADKTDWISSLPPTDHPFIAILYRSPQTHQGVQAGLTVRVDELTSSQSLKNYVKRWLTDYPRLGFSILDSKPIKIREQRAFLLDLINHQTSKQLRQVIFLKKKTAVILTCRDHRQTFKQTVNTCNEIISHFEWNI